VQQLPHRWLLQIVQFSLKKVAKFFSRVALPVMGLTLKVKSRHHSLELEPHQLISK
jgi:hypothetical protein